MTSAVGVRPHSRLGDPPGVIQRSGREADVRYVILEDSSDWPFRRRARAWLAAADNNAGESSPRVFELGGERVLVMDSGHLSAGQTMEGFLLVRGNFSCGAGCRFLRPVYVGGNCEIGKGSRLEMIAVDGTLTLCPSVEVRGKADSLGTMEIRCGCHVGSLASSGTSIRLSLQAEIAELFAPQIVTPAGVTPPAGLRQGPRDTAIIIPPPGKQARPFTGLAGEMDPAKLQPLGADTWVFEADLHLTKPVLLRAHLVTAGAFSCPAGSLLGGDVKAGGAISVGAGSVIQNNLLADGDLILGPGSVFQREVRSRQRMRLCSGVRGFREQGPVDVWAAGELVLEEDVAIRGRVRSACRVLAIAAAPVNLKGAAAARAGQ